MLELEQEALTVITMEGRHLCLLINHLVSHQAMVEQILLRRIFQSSLRLRAIKVGTFQMQLLDMGLLSKFIKLVEPLGEALH